MPIGLIADCFSVLLGGLAGAAVEKRLSARMQLNLTVVLGFCSCSIAINSIIEAANMTPVVAAVILGTLLGEGLDLERRITTLFRRAMRHLPHDPATFDMERFVTVVVLCCASGFAIYGVLVEGMSDDPSILLSKAALDFCTAAIFAVTLGVAVALVALPMALVLGIVYLAAGALAPLVTPVMFQDFVACGGVLTLAAGLRVSGIKNFPIANLIPALVLVLPASALWIRMVG